MGCGSGSGARSEIAGILTFLGAGCRNVSSASAVPARKPCPMRKPKQTSRARRVTVQACWERRGLVQHLHVHDMIGTHSTIWPLCNKRVQETRVWIRHCDAAFRIQRGPKPLPRRRRRSRMSICLDHGVRTWLRDGVGVGDRKRRRRTNGTETWGENKFLKVQFAIHKVVDFAQLLRPKPPWNPVRENIWTWKNKWKNQDTKTNENSKKK